MSGHPDRGVSVSAELARGVTRFGEPALQALCVNQSHRASASGKIVVNFIQRAVCVLILQSFGEKLGGRLDKHQVFWQLRALGEYLRALFFSLVSIYGVQVHVLEKVWFFKDMFFSEDSNWTKWDSWNCWLTCKRKSGDLDRNSPRRFGRWADRFPVSCVGFHPHPIQVSHNYSDSVSNRPCGRFGRYRSYCWCYCLSLWSHLKNFHQDIFSSLLTMSKILRISFDTVYFILGFFVRNFERSLSG